jgi:hypothetical protein
MWRCTCTLLILVHSIWLLPRWYTVTLPAQAGLHKATFAGILDKQIDRHTSWQAL